MVLCGSAGGIRDDKAVAIVAYLFIYRRLSLLCSIGSHRSVCGQLVKLSG